MGEATSSIEIKTGQAQYTDANGDTQTLSGNAVSLGSVKTDELDSFKTKTFKELVGSGINDYDTFDQSGYRPSILMYSATNDKLYWVGNTIYEIDGITGNTAIGDYLVESDGSWAGCNYAWKFNTITKVS